MDAQRRRNDSPARAFVNYQRVPEFENGEYYGEHLVELDDGPMVTDGPHLVSFSIVSIITLIIGLWAFFKGRPSTLMAHSNFEGRYCGIDDPYRAMPYTYYPLSPNGKEPQLMLSNAQCVQQCPGIDDVGKALSIPMTQEERDSLNPGSGSLYIQYNVRSPMYATELQLGICIPKDPTLRRDLFHHLVSYTSQMRRSIASLQRAYPIMAFYSILAGVLFFTVMVGLLPTIPRITQYIVVVGCITTSFLLGGQTLLWGSSQIYKLPTMYAEAMPSLPVICNVMGILLILCATGGMLLMAANWAVITDGISIFKAYNEVFRNLKSVAIAPVILAAMALLVTFTWIRTIENLVSMNHIRAIAPKEVAVPFSYRVTEFPVDAKIAAVVVTMGLAWVIYLIRTISRYCGAYTAVVWYFCDDCEYKSRKVHVVEALRSLQMAWTVSLGSNTFFALLMPICNGMRYCFAFASRRRSPHFTQADNDDLCETFITTTPTESLMAAQVAAKYLGPMLPTLAAVCDFYTNAALAEIILVAREFLPAMAYARRRLVKSGPLVRTISVGRFIGSFDIFSFHLKTFFALTTMILTFNKLSAEPHINYSAGANALGDGYTMPDSPKYVANPIFATIIIGMLFYIIVDIALGFYEGIIDTISYCYTIDVHGGDVVSPTFAGGGQYEEHPCMVPRAPKGLVKLLTSLLENEIGIVFQDRPVVMTNPAYEMEQMYMC